MQKTLGSKTAQQTKKRNIQIINNLKQTLSKPTIVQAQRTLKILQKLIERISIFMNLDTQFIIKFNQINNPQKFRLNKTLVQQLSSQVLDAITKQAKMQIQFRIFAGIEQQLKQNEVVQQERLRQYERTRKDLAYTFKFLIRVIEKHPQDIEILKNLRLSSIPNIEVSNIHEGLANYKIIMQKTMATAAQQQQSHTRLIEQLQMKIESLEKTKNNCDRQLLKLREDRAKHAEDKKQQMDKLKSQIREVRSNKQRQMEQIAKNSKQKSQTLTREYKKQQDNLKTMIAQQRTKLAKMRDENSKAENKSKTDKLTSQNHLSDLITTYDSEMSKLHGTFNSTQKQLKKITDQLNNLKRHFLQIQQERGREQALIEADRKRRHLWQLMEKKKGQAITKIKEAFRNWKNKNKKKKKKKKKVQKK